MHHKLPGIQPSMEDIDPCHSRGQKVETLHHRYSTGTHTKTTVHYPPPPCITNSHPTPTPTPQPPKEGLFFFRSAALSQKLAKQLFLQKEPTIYCRASLPAGCVDMIDLLTSTQTNTQATPQHNAKQEQCLAADAVQCRVSLIYQYRVSLSLLALLASRKDLILSTNCSQSMMGARTEHFLTAAPQRPKQLLEEDSKVPRGVSSKTPSKVNWGH